MKVRSLCAAAMVAAIGAATFAPLGASAATATPHEAISTGEVIVEAGGLDPTDPITDPEKPGDGEKPLDPDDFIPGVNPGPLGISNVSPLNFGTIQTGSSAIHKAAAAQNVHPMVEVLDVDGNPVLDADGNIQLEPEATTVERGAMVVFGDVRGTNAGYKVQAELTKQFTRQEAGADTTDTLNAASISYNYGIMETSPSNPASPGTMTNSTFELSMAETNETGEVIAGGAVDVVDAAVGTGAGRYTLEFGQSGDYLQSDANIATGGQQGTAATAVVLNVPTTTVSSMVLGDYVAHVTWTIGALA